MMTSSEARRRAELNEGQIKWSQTLGEYRVTLNEWRGAEAERNAYYTDDLEDAVLTLGALRRRASHAAS